MSALEAANQQARQRLCNSRLNKGFTYKSRLCTRGFMLLMLFARSLRALRLCLASMGFLAGSSCLLALQAAVTLLDQLMS